MSATPPNLIRRELKNARLYFMPAGDTVDSVVVAAELWPDGSPASTITPYEFPDIETVQFDRTIKAESFMIASHTGGYTEDPEEMVTKRMWTFDTHKTNSYVKRLENGLATIPVANTAQADGVVADNYMEGLAIIEEQNKDGTMIARRMTWARLRVKTSGKDEPATAKVELTLEARYSSLNSYITY